MIVAVAAAAAMAGLTVAAVVVRRRLVVRARVARRLAPAADPIAKRLFRLHATPVVPTMSETDAA